MVLPSADWKNQSSHLFDWLNVLVAGMLTVLYLYQWLQGAGVLYAALAGVLIAWGIMYFTALWQPILYLPVAVIVSITTGFWIVNGRWEQPLIKGMIILNLIFILLSGYLFFYEEPME